MTHPIHILAADGSLQARHVEELAKHCSSSKPGPGDSTAFTFLAGDINDFHDRIIVADPAVGRYTMERPDGCVCDFTRTPIECQCRATQCHDCGGEFTAIEAVCDFIYCLFDECPLCTHQRESCQAHVVERDVKAEWRSQQINHPGDTDAEHVYGAVAAVLGADSGDAPNFPVVRRILGRIAGSDEDESAWRLPDGSVLRLDPRNPAWLNYPENAPVAS